MSIARNNCVATAANPCAVNAGAPAGDAWTMQQSTTSRLGFRGNEDLGGGPVGPVPDRTPLQPGHRCAEPDPVLERPQLRPADQRRCGLGLPGPRVHPGVLGRTKSGPVRQRRRPTGVTYLWAGSAKDAGLGFGVTTNPQANWPAGGSGRSSNTVGYKDAELRRSDGQRRGESGGEHRPGPWPRLQRRVRRRPDLRRPGLREDHRRVPTAVVS